MQLHVCSKHYTWIVFISKVFHRRKFEFSESFPTTYSIYWTDSLFLDEWASEVSNAECQQKQVDIAVEVMQNTVNEELCSLAVNTILLQTMSREFKRSPGNCVNVFKFKCSGVLLQLHVNRASKKASDGDREQLLEHSQMATIMWRSPRHWYQTRRRYWSTELMVQLYPHRKMEMNEKKRSCVLPTVEEHLKLTWLQKTMNLISVFHKSDSMYRCSMQGAQSVDWCGRTETMPKTEGRSLQNNRYACWWTSAGSILGRTWREYEWLVKDRVPICRRGFIYLSFQNRFFGEESVEAAVTITYM